MNGKHLVGKKVRIQHQEKDGSMELIEGIVSAYTPANGCYQIDKAHLVKGKNLIYLGVHYCYSDDEAIIAVIGEVDSQSCPVERSSTRNDLENYTVPLKEIHACSKKMNTTDSQEQEGQYDDDGEEEDAGDGEDELPLVLACEDDSYVEYFFEVKLDALKHRASNKVEKINEENCVSIVSSIANSKTIGVAACGDDVSRHGEIEFVLVSADSGNYIFCTRFIAKLRNILESSSVLKVVHKSRYFVDALFFLHGIKMENIYDTAPIHYFVVDQASHGMRQQKSLASLYDCLKYYFNLKVPSDQLRFKQLSRDVLSKSVESYVRRQVLLLRQMYYIQLSCLFYPHKHSIGLYALGLRELDDEEYKEVVKHDDKLVRVLRQNQLLTSYDPPYIEEPFILN